jgi:hypothetical protein
MNTELESFSFIAIAGFLVLCIGIELGCVLGMILTWVFA